ncbi:MAG: ABC transporter substrate-binding protein [Acidobacteriota bacterium]
MTHSTSKILRVGGLNEVRYTDPQTAQDTESMFVVKQLFESPYGTVFGATDVEPVLFDGPVEAVTAMRWRGRVRGDVCFSDGSPMTADDVARSLSESGIIREAATVQREGDDIVFDLVRPNARFDLTLAHGQCGVVRRQGSRLIGTGPFVLDDASRPDHIRLVRNPHHRPEAKLDEVHFVTYPLDADGRPTALIAALEAGEVDLTTSLGRDDLQAVSGVRKSIKPGASTCLLYLVCDGRDGLRDARVRRAIGHGLDRFELAKISYSNALAFAASSVLPRTLGAGDEHLAHDPTKARRCLAEADAVPESLSMLVIWGPRPYLPDPEGTATAIAEQIGRLGIRVEIEKAANSTDYFEKVIAGTHDLILAGWVADTMDPVDFLETNLASYSGPKWENQTVSTHSGRLKSAEMDELIAAARVDSTSGSLDKILELAATEASLVPLMYGASATVWSFQVQDFVPSPMAHYPLTALDVSG